MGGKNGVINKTNQAIKNGDELMFNEIHYTI